MIFALLVVADELWFIEDADIKVEVGVFDEMDVVIPLSNDVAIFIYDCDIDSCPGAHWTYTELS